MSGEFVVGDLVRHPDYGIGEVVDVTDDRCCVEFDEGEINILLSQPNVPLTQVFREGVWVRHSSWGEGLIKQREESSVIIDFHNKKKHRMSLSIAANSLDAIPDNSFSHRYLDAPEEVKKALINEPLDTIICILDELGGKANRIEIQHFLEKILTPDEWKKWWTRARAEMKKDQRIRISGGTKCICEIMENPEEELIERCITAPGVSERLQLAEECYDMIKNPGNLVPLIDAFKTSINDEKYPVTERLAIYVFLKLNNNEAEVEFPFEEINNPEILRETITIFKHLKILKQALKEILSMEFPVSKDDIYTEFLLYSQDSIKNEAFSILSGYSGRDTIHKKILSFLENDYQKNPINAFFWARELLYNKIEIPETNKLELLDNVLNFYILTVSSDKKYPAGFIDKTKAVLQDFDLLMDILEKAPSDGLGPFCDTYVANSGFSKQALDQFLGVLALLGYDDLVERYQGVEADVKEEKIVTKKTQYLMTEKTFSKLNKKLTSVIEKEIPDTVRRIATAREWGDLKENAEYHAAREHHRVLSKLTEDIQDKLRTARVVRSKDITGDKVGFGVKVTLLKLDEDKNLTYSILGPDDISDDEDILSYLSPMAEQLNEKKVDDEVEWNGTTYRILDIQPCL